MDFLDSARVAKLIRREEKQENLERFIGCYLDRLSVIAAPAPGDSMVTVIARSPSSPVAIALGSAIGELRSLGVVLGVVFAKLEPAEPLSSWIDLAQPASGERGMVSLRWARNPCLLDAHEQMVLGPVMCWSGDCMRRPPEARDAYELFDACNEESARRAALSFRSLWDASEAICLARAPLQSGSMGVAEGAPVAHLPGGLPQTVIFGTRH
jgi:hypothetical protein